MLFFTTKNLLNGFPPRMPERNETYLTPRGAIITAYATQAPMLTQR